MISYPQSLQSIAPAHTGIGAAHLLDVCDTNGNIYYWASRKILALSAIDANSLAGNPATTLVTYVPWILRVPELKFYRSLQTDTVSIEMQYLSGDTLQRDFDRIVRGSAIEGALFVYRYWEASAEAAFVEMHGTLSVTSPPTATTVTLTGKQMSNGSKDPTPLLQFGESCGWVWASPQCGSTQPTECQHSFLTCQVQERFQGTINTYEKNYGPADSNVSTKVMNRLRQY